MQMQTLDSLEARGKRVLLRADLDVPLKTQRSPIGRGSNISVRDPRALRPGCPGHHLQSFRTPKRPTRRRDVAAAPGRLRSRICSVGRVGSGEHASGRWPRRPWRHSPMATSSCSAEYRLRLPAISIRPSQERAELNRQSDFRGLSGDCRRKLRRQSSSSA